MCPHVTDRRRLINLGKAEEIIELILWSGCIENANPLSLIISSKVGAGKTELIEQYRECRGVHMATETTAYGLKRDCLEAITSGKIRHLMIPDLLAPLSKQKKTRDDFIAFMNSVMEEGVGDIHTYAIQREGKGFARCGLITTIAKADFIRKSRRWHEMGFLSRAIPLTYDYSVPTKMKVYEHIASCDNLKDIPLKTIWLPNEKLEVKPNKDLNIRLIEKAMDIEKWEDAYGFRRLEQLETLLMANALKNTRFKPTEEDYEKVMEMLEYINLSFREI